MNKEVVRTEKAPAAIGPYSQAVRAGGFLFLSGQIPLHPQTGELVGADAATQTSQILDNISAVLEAAGLTLESVVKTTIFLADLAHFSAVNEIYGSRFKQNPPARSTVEVKGLPRGSLVEIEAIAVC